MANVPTVQIRQSDKHEQRDVVSLLLTGRVQPDSVVVDSFLHYVREHGLSLDHLWAAWQDQHPLAAAFVAVSPGKTAMIFLSPVQQPHLVPVAARLLQELTRRQSPHEVCLLQVLLDPEHDLARQAFEQADFSPLAELIYMTRSCPRRYTGLLLPPEVQAVTWASDTADLFRQAILASYEQTLDCPGLLGLRQIDDIMAGHMSVGRFDPNLWLVLHRQDEPVGVMLINRVPNQRVAELVYLGLAPAWRGQGLGRMLLSHGMSLVHRQGCRRMILAVDQHNTPAMGLYRSMGFTPEDRKLAMIRPLA